MLLKPGVASFFCPRLAEPGLFQNNRNTRFTLTTANATSRACQTSPGEKFTHDFHIKTSQSARRSRRRAARPA
ncbi:hypothetical protein EYF80_033718 [Liparis tanakae]|uniref:Uncharacterized protein n=1 Tax=Liparis tanakae TaxID=230148 RepID=A0A4Z2GR86_9TELE|nr:hypothetical protein EYF80_033718 [Liparis tanakae]